MAELIKLDLQFFGGRGSGSGMSGGGSGGGSQSVQSKNGVTASEAIENYWSTGWRGDKSDLAKEIAKGRNQYAEEYAKREKKYDQTVVNEYSGRTNLSDFQRNTVLGGAQRRLQSDNYNESGKNRYDNMVAMASADVAKRMGYDISGSMGVGSISVSDLRNAMGKSNADNLMRRVINSAPEAIDSHKRRRR